MKPAFSSNACCIVVAAMLLYGCSSDTGGGATGLGGAGGTTGAGGAGGTTGAGGGPGGTTTGAGGRSSGVLCTYPESARCLGQCGDGVRDVCYFYLGLGIDCSNSFV
jgi:hypothetical protein